MNDHLTQGQKLTETWAISFERKRYDSPIDARLDSWPHTRYYGSLGRGKTIEEARLNLVTMLAKAIHEDPNPFGDLGQVLHADSMLKFLHSLKKGELSGDPHYIEPASDHYLADNFEDLPEGWERVIECVITMFQSYMDYWPEEETISSADTKSLTPPSGDDVA